MLSKNENKPMSEAPLRRKIAQTVRQEIHRLLIDKTNEQISTMYNNLINLELQREQDDFLGNYDRGIFGVSNVL